MESLLVHGPGDLVGLPFRLTRRNRRFIWRCYELHPDGSRVYTRAIKGEPKGKAKTELVAAIALAEMAGPVRFDGWTEDGKPLAKQQVSPDIPVCASSFKQADVLFGCAVTMIKEGPLNDFLECFDTEIRFRDQRPGVLYRVPAVAGANDGARPTFVAFDEIHEFTGSKERAHTVLSNGVAKRKDAWECIITTAGADPGLQFGEPDTLLGGLYLHGKRVQAGEIEDDELLFEWMEVKGKVDMNDPKAIAKALLQVYPDGERFQPLSKLVKKVQELVARGKAHEARRYFFNVFTAFAESWLPDGKWESLEVEPFEFDPEEPVYVGVDSATKHDSHANVYAQWRFHWEEGEHGPERVNDALRLRAHIWERPRDRDGRPVADWKLPIAEVENDLREAHRQWNLDSVNYDPALFERSAQVLELEGLPMIEVPQSSARMVPAAQATYELIVQDRAEHEGDPVFSRHMAAAVAVEVTAGGFRLKKGKAKAKMDAAIATTMAVDAAVQIDERGTSVYDERGVTVA